MKKTVLVTGATSGIGKAIAEKFSQAGHRLIITGRREERLNHLVEAMRKSGNTAVYKLVFDIRDRKAVEEAIDSLPEEWKDIDVLVNNAGLAVGLEPIQEGVIDDWERMIDTNVKGLLYISRKIMPVMIKRKTGHIINIGSIAGKETYPNGNVYCASKHAVDALSKAMRTDLLPHRIKVTQIRPGLVETEFSEVRFKGDKKTAAKVYEGFQALTGADIAEIALFAVSLPEHVNLNDIEVTPMVQANSFIKNI
jgi:NADP-dependent 3-hydroxy acid dehydrogenase YdfG